MARIGDELRDIWVREGAKLVARGDAAKIDDWLANKLVKVGVDPSGWATLYRHSDTGEFWELSYPQAEAHGGGPRCLRCLGSDAAAWGKREV